MTSKQLLVLIAISAVTFLALLLGGGYVYLTNPALLGLPVKGQQDSLSKPPAVWEIELDRLQQELKSVRTERGRLQDSLARLSAQLGQLRTQYEQVQQQLTAAQTSLATMERLGQQDSLGLKNLRVVAEMYDRADPAEVAKILANAESPYAAAVLRLMKRKTAARVLEQLPKDKALAISLASLEQR